MLQRSTLRVYPQRKVKEADNFLIDIHGQHEHQSLTGKKMQLALLDDYAKEETQKVKAEVKKCYEEYFFYFKRIGRKKILIKKRQERELSFLEFEIQELEDACLRKERGRGVREDLPQNAERQKRLRKHVELLTARPQRTVKVHRIRSEERPRDFSSDFL